MARCVCPDIVVFVCANCIPAGGRLPQAWDHEGARVRVQEIPCSGKIDGQYLLHALEEGSRGLCVVACPVGDCHLGQGNFRAEIRVRTVQRLLAEMGLEPQRAELVRCSPNDPPEHLRALVDQALARIYALGESPLLHLEARKASTSV